MNKKRTSASAHLHRHLHPGAAIAIWLYVDRVRQPRSVPMKVKNIPVEFSGESTTLADKRPDAAVGL